MNLCNLNCHPEDDPHLGGEGGVKHGAKLVHHSQEELGQIIDVRRQDLEESVLVEIYKRLLVEYLAELGDWFRGS